MDDNKLTVTKLPNLTTTARYELDAGGVGATIFGLDHTVYCYIHDESGENTRCLAVTPKNDANIDEVIHKYVEEIQELFATLCEFDKEFLPQA